MSGLSPSQVASIGGNALVRKLREEGGKSAVRKHFRKLSAMAGSKRGRRRLPTYSEIVASRRGARLRDRLENEQEVMTNSIATATQERPAATGRS